MAGQMQYAKAKRAQRARDAARGKPDENDELSHPITGGALRGCRLGWDGEPFPVTITRIDDRKEKTDA